MSAVVLVIESTESVIESIGFWAVGCSGRLGSSWESWAETAAAIEMKYRGDTGDTLGGRGGASGVFWDSCGPIWAPVHGAHIRAPYSRPMHQ